MIVPVKAKKIDPDQFVSDIVADDYRTAGVFRKYGIDFLAKEKSLKGVCTTKGLDIGTVSDELQARTRAIQLPNALDFEGWDVDFLTEYIVHVHHEYLRTALPEAKDYLVTFIEEQGKEFPYLFDLIHIYNELLDETFPHLQQEEVIIFPYIRQIAHALGNKEPYAGLLVRTLRKPVENVMHHEHAVVNKLLHEMRRLTHSYLLPEDACLCHRIAYLKLREIDEDLIQHLYLENDVLFPRAIAMEKELLERRDE